MSKYYELNENDNPIHIIISKYGYGKTYFEIKRLKEKNEELRALYESEREVKEDYKSKIDKAIEYIERKQKEWNECSYKDKINLYMFETYLYGVSEMITIKEILKGVDKE